MAELSGVAHMIESRDGEQSVGQIVQVHCSTEVGHNSKCVSNLGHNSWSFYKVNWFSQALII